MDAPAATLDPLVMQNAVDRFGGRAQPTFCGCPGIPNRPTTALLSSSLLIGMGPHDLFVRIIEFGR
jgi:hypothetical protein